VSGHSQLKLLILHGSRARDDAHVHSDWDFGYLAGAGFDASLLYADLAVALKTDAVDVADLARASGLLRYRAARDAVVVYEASAGEFERFWFEAVSFWCDAEPVLRDAYRSILKELGP
jgi:predicted nucleotidyltransferase